MQLNIFIEALLFIFLSSISSLFLDLVRQLSSLRVCGIIMITFCTKALRILVLDIKIPSDESLRWCLELSLTILWSQQTILTRVLGTVMCLLWHSIYKKDSKLLPPALLNWFTNTVQTISAQTSAIRKESNVPKLKSR